MPLLSLGGGAVRPPSKYAPGLWHVKDTAAAISIDYLGIIHWLTQVNPENYMKNVKGCTHQMAAVCVCVLY